MSDISGVKALLIEDDQTSINVLAQLLKKHDAELETISDSINIEEHLEQVAVPDIIFLDLEMPRHNGYTILKMIQSIPDFEGIPVVAYTTHVSHLNDANDAGFHSFLSKPLDTQFFADQVFRILSGERVWEVS